MSVRVDLGGALWRSRGSDPADVPELLRQVAGPIGAVDLAVSLADFEQTRLLPLRPAPGGADGDADGEEITTTMAGRAFLTQAPVVAERDGRYRVWVPVLEGSARTGVLAVTVDDDDAATVTACEELGLLAGLLIATHARSTDAYGVSRRRRTMTLPASMQWDLLPPLVLKTAGATVAGMLEPAYEVGGDAFDYAVNGPVLDVAVIDAMGHGVASSMVAALTVGAYRHSRRQGLPPELIHRRLDEVLAAEYHAEAFATGQLAQLDLGTGQLRWVNAGHPLPLLIRQGRLVGQLRCPPTVPWGLGPSRPEAAVEALEPGDGLLFYTDGVVEAHAPGGEGFGVERLADLAGQHASEEIGAEEIVRRLVRAVLDHQGQTLADDATVVLLQWDGPPAGAPERP